MTKEGGNISEDLWDFIVSIEARAGNIVRCRNRVCIISRFALLKMLLNVNFLFRLFSLLIKINDST